MNSFFERSGIDLKVPDYSLICRRSKSLSVGLCAIKSVSATDIVVDSTGLKVYGEGEWKVRKHGAGKHRTWMKLHIALDEKSQQIEAITLTTNAVDDATEVAPLLDQIQRKVKSLKGVGAYDKAKVRRRLTKDGITQVIPPQRNSVISKTKDKHLQKRAEDIETIKAIGSKEWKVQSNYRQRSKVKTVMFKYKTIIGETAIN